MDDELLDTLKAINALLSYDGKTTPQATAKGMLENIIERASLPSAQPKRIVCACDCDDGVDWSMGSAEVCNRCEGSGEYSIPNPIYAQPSDVVDDGTWEEALDSLYESIKENDVDGWEVELVRRRVKAALTTQQAQKQEDVQRLVEAARNLEPLRDLDFHGKWRIHGVLDALAPFTANKGD